MIHNIILKYDDKDYAELEPIKDTSGKTWEGFVLGAARTYKTVWAGWESRTHPGAEDSYNLIIERGKQ